MMCVEWSIVVSIVGQLLVSGDGWANKKCRRDEIFFLSSSASVGKEMQETTTH